MTKKKTPKWGYRKKSHESDGEIKTYSDEQIANLAREYFFEIPEDIDVLQRGLEAAASNYRYFQANEDEAPRPSEMRPAVSEIQNLINQLLDKLENLDDSTSHLFWLPEIEVSNLVEMADFPKEPTILESKFGHTIALIPDGENAFHHNRLGKEDYFEALKILQNYCAAALERIPNDPGGSRPSEALRMWIVNVENFWTNHFGREFTLDYHQGKPVSETARFCCDAFAVIDPTIPQSKIIGTMKNRITEKRTLHNRETPPNN